MKLFIGSSSSDLVPDKYMDDCLVLLRNLFFHKHVLVFGACKTGLMGLSYKVATANERDVIGIFPEIYQSEAEEIDCLHIPVKTISERTDKLIENSDALIFLPGGIGTVYELFTAIESKRSHEFDKPIIIYNSCGYFDKLLAFMDLMYEDKFSSTKVKDNYCVCNNPDDVLRYLNDYCNSKSKSSDVKKRKKL